MFKCFYASLSSVEKLQLSAFLPPLSTHPWFNESKLSLRSCTMKTNFTLEQLNARITVPFCGFWNWRPVRFMDSCISNSTHGTLSHLSARPILQISFCQTKLSLLMDFPHPVLSISSKTACVEASGTNVLPWPYLPDVAKVFLCRDR